MYLQIICNIRLFWITLALGLILISAPAHALGEADSCISAKCHTGLDQSKYLHGPIAAGVCAVCHGENAGHAENPKRNRFATITNVGEVCFNCHEKFPSRKMMHGPVAEGDCTACHSPHGGPNKYLLLEKGGALCLNCHDRSLVDKTYVHGPAAVGGCIACHEPHSADYDHILKQEGTKLCFTCHIDKAEALGQAEFVHTPVAQDCVACHDPHSEDQKFMLTATAPQLCLDCHEDKKDQLGSVKVKHRAMQTDKSCLNCHDAHLSNYANNLLMDPLDLCLSCHDRTYSRSKGKELINMKQLLEENSDHHGPIRQKDCSGCHDPHGSPYFRILKEPYPSSFYQGFDPDSYRLCFSCHESSIMLDMETAKLTNFRNGEQNLHFAHVNKPVKGRTCRACHETHASNYPKHIREAVPFGAWELPLNFEKTKTGGSCTPGCHKLLKYDRVKREGNQ